MALINCAECGREISDKAASCPGCGSPVHAAGPAAVSATTARTSATRHGIGSFALFTTLSIGAVLAILIIIYVAHVIGPGVVKDQPPTASPIARPGLFANPVTLAEYEQIRKGMTYDEVSSIIGAPGQESSRVDLAGHTTVMYSWVNPNGSNMNAMFQNGHLISKAQLGLR